MATIDWKLVWSNSLQNKDLFPFKKVSDKKISVSCPTRFSSKGEFTIEVSPLISDEMINLEILIFNDNVSLDDIKVSEEKVTDFNTLAKNLNDWEQTNKILDRFEISSEGFESNEEAEDALIDYLNNKATESGRMFDDKLDELNDSLEQTASESYNRLLTSIRESRKFILKKVERILNREFSWKPAKNEDLNDSVASFYDENDNLVAIVTLADNELIIDLSKDISSKINILQSDEEIEDEIVNDIENSKVILANDEIEQLSNVVGESRYTSSKEDSLIEEMCKKVSKLENLYIKHKLRKLD